MSVKLRVAYLLFMSFSGGFKWSKGYGYGMAWEVGMEIQPRL